MLDLLMNQPVAWRLETRDFSGHRPGQPLPRPHRRVFDRQEAAALELRRLRAAAGPDLAGCITEIRPKLPPAQTDFGFAPGEKRRLTA